MEKKSGRRDSRCWTLCGRNSMLPFLCYSTSTSTPLLTSLRRLLSSRHASPPLPSQILSQLETTVTTHLLRSLISTLPLDLPTIQAYHILSLWLPYSWTTNSGLGGGEYGNGAVFLDRALAGAREQRLGKSADASSRRLWFSLSLTQAVHDLQNGNLPRLAGIEDIESALGPLDPARPDEARLILQARLLTITEHALRFIAAYHAEAFVAHEIALFSESVLSGSGGLREFEGWNRAFVRIAAVADEIQTPFFTALNALSHFCQTTICFHAVMRLRLMVPLNAVDANGNVMPNPGANANASSNVEPGMGMGQEMTREQEEVAKVFKEGVNLLARRVCGALEDLIILILGNTLDIKHLTSWTDTHALVLTYSAALLVKIHVITVSGWRRCLDFAEDTFKLLTKLLDKISLCPPSTLTRLAGLVRSLMKVWQERAATVLQGQGGKTMSEDQVSYCLAKRHDEPSPFPQPVISQDFHPGFETKQQPAYANNLTVSKLATQNGYNHLPPHPLSYPQHSNGHGNENLNVSVNTSGSGSVSGSVTSQGTGHGNSLPTPEETEANFELHRHPDLLHRFEPAVVFPHVLPPLPMPSDAAHIPPPLWNNLSAVLDDDLFNLFSYGPVYPST
ncbi:hypothetical protein BT69DRAFT_490361 [Atractiella rhizophila]|nr:hypothetical protein BT69DRAFT_490361 [Atractiella rhizophila]